MRFEKRVTWLWDMTFEKKRKELGRNSGVGEGGEGREGEVSAIIQRGMRMRKEGMESILLW